jgi:hypothetical protein
VIRDAINWLYSPPAFRQIDDGKAGLCLKNVRYAFGIGPKYGTAYQAALNAGALNPLVRGSKVRNRPVFWSGGSHGYGHIAILDGCTKVGRRARCWTTDWPNPLTGKADGKWRRVPVDTISARWGLRLMGWSSSLNGEHIDI